MRGQLLEMPQGAEGEAPHVLFVIVRTVARLCA